MRTILWGRFYDTLDKANESRDRCYLRAHRAAVRRTQERRDERAGMIDPIVALLYGFGFAAIFVPAAYAVLLRYTNLA